MEAVRGLDFAVEPGEVFALIGPNGAGKTTTLRMVATILKPTAGELSVCDIDARTQPGRARERIAYLPEEAGAYRNLTGLAYLEFSAALVAADARERAAMVERGAEISGLGERLRDKVGTYSKGMTRKLLLARGKDRTRAGARVRHAADDVHPDRAVRGDHVLRADGGERGRDGEGDEDAAGAATDAALRALGLRLDAGDYALLGLTLFAGILVALAIAVVLGAFAESARSAQALLTPLVMLLLVPYMLSMFLDLQALPDALRTAVMAIPFTHVFLAGPSLFMGETRTVWLGIAYQMAWFAAFVAIAARVFASDRILTMRLGKRRG